MNYLWIPLLVAVIIMVVKNIMQNKSKNKEIINEIEIVEEIKEDIKLPYIRKNLMTKNEWRFYKELKTIADKMNYSILCKTRVADLVEIKNGLNKSEWQTAFNRINKKHIDFILCKPENLLPILLIELDDSSHETDKNKKRDKFIEKLYKETKYQLLRVKGTSNLEEKIIECLKKEQKEITPHKLTESL